LVVVTLLARSAGAAALAATGHPNCSQCHWPPTLRTPHITHPHSGQRARVHWRFLPGSYAEWVPVRTAPNAGAERSEPQGGKLPWRVTLRWAMDSEKYNEW